MKSLTKGVFGSFVVIMALAALLTGVANAQSGNPFQITGVKANVEGAIQLNWQSETNIYYRVDYADQLDGNGDGTTAWNTLYSDYPSHGTNTFWLDTGYYTPVPPIPHPKYMPMRFYRVVVEGTNTAPPPTVAITSPADGDVVRGDLTVTVSSSSDQPVLRTLLYVDGQEMPESDDGTNYTINTCEWPNGPHTLFAVAKSQSGFEGLMNDSSVTYGRAVSSYVNVTFDNLISGYSFSQPFFEPSLGQTQQVSATFAANVNWTLEIQDANSNDVLYVTGSGVSMEYNWDGNGTNGASLPDGVYTYLLTAQTNGQAFQSQITSASVSDSTELFAMPADGSGAAVPLIFYPPGFDTNGLTIFEASWSEIMAPSTALLSTSGSTDGATPMYSGASSQSARGPQRPPPKPVKGSVGYFGIGYASYLPSGISSRPPRTGWPYPLPTYVAIDGLSANATVYAGPVRVHKECADAFSAALQKGGWKPVFNYPDIRATDIKKASLGGSSIFNRANIGLMMAHGSYATTSEDDNVKYTYINLDNGGGGLDYVRLTDMDFGSSGAFGLRWMAIAACNILRGANFSSMSSSVGLPVNGNCHLLSGASTIFYGNQVVGKFYARNMLANQTISNAWINASQKAYSYATSATVPDAVNVRIVGWHDCFNDTLSNYYDPDTGDGLQYIDVNVYTPH